MLIYIVFENWSWEFDCGKIAFDGKMGVDDMTSHIPPYCFFAAIKINVWRKEMIKIDTIVLNPLTFITMIITNMGRIYFDEKRENVFSITLQAVLKITAGIQVLKFRYEVTNNFLSDLLRFDEYMHN